MGFDVLSFLTTAFNPDGTSRAMTALVPSLSTSPRDGHVMIPGRKGQADAGKGL